MSLVAYESSSDESEEELDKEKKISTTTTVSNITKKREPVKIIVPTITEDEEEITSPAKKEIKSSSSLLSMLPPPKFSFTTKSKTSTLVPHVLTKNKEPTKVVPKKIEPAAKYSFAKRKCPDDTIENDTDEGISGADFFSLQNSENETESISLPSLEKKPRLNLPAPKLIEPCIAPDDSDFTNFNAQSSVNISNIPYPDSNLYSAQEPTTTTAISSENTSENSNNSNQDLDPKFVKWHEKFWGNEEINIVDVDINKELKNSKEWRVKAISEEKQAPNTFRQPTHRQKKKHQITYLAFQAKERELDLKNQWAQNRLSRRETQAKYGF